MLPLCYLRFVSCEHDSSWPLHVAGLYLLRHRLREDHRARRLLEAPLPRMIADGYQLLAELGVPVLPTVIAMVRSPYSLRPANSGKLEVPWFSIFLRKAS